MPIGIATAHVNRIVPSEMKNVSTMRSPMTELISLSVSIDRPRLPWSSPSSFSSKELSQ